MNINPYTKRCEKDCRRAVHKESGKPVEKQRADLIKILRCNQGISRKIKVYTNQYLRLGAEWKPE
jgi:hypothetical protein